MYVKQSVGGAVENSQENTEPDTVLRKIPDQEKREERYIRRKKGIWTLSPKKEREMLQRCTDRNSGRLPFLGIRDYFLKKIIVE